MRCSPFCRAGLAGPGGRVGAFSFFGNKNMTCGEGGMVTTNDDAVAARVRNMRSHGMTTLTYDRYKGRAVGYDVISHGYNYRMDEIRSALALVQLGRLDGFLAERRRIRDRYCERLINSDITVPDFEWKRISAPGDSVGYHIMPVLVPEGVDRDGVAAMLKENGIQSSMHYRPIHQFSAFSSAADGGKRLLLTEKLAERQITLPMYPTMTNDQVDLVCECLVGSLSGSKRE
jgi:dTDP-4-amino-4,6-dideoxygalactose transaminase